MYRFLLMAMVLALSSAAATLQQLTLDDMINKSTDIVRGKVASQSASFRSNLAGRGGMIYTHYIIDVSERYKGGSARMDVAVPGGTTQGYKQMFAGAPSLKIGDDFVFFLWTSRSGLTQIIGLTQGLFTLLPGTGGKLTASRVASSEAMLDSSGNPVTDGGLNLSLADLKSRINSVLARTDQ